MQAELHTRSHDTDWEGAVPMALDVRLIALVGVVAALAASLNVPYGGLTFAAIAFALLAGAGTLSHLLGERRLRGRLEALLTHWQDAGLEVERVERADGLTETGWTVRTPEGPIRIGGVALAPLTKLTVDGPNGRMVFQVDDDESLAAVVAECLESNSRRR